jgi:alkanesulfonate monooxygenase SsuD/methylene tetrahydromethanopterin reductase-like flavin-dependent oxidoreductase (luciferase family)
MRFGIFYEHQLPRPWADGDEEQLLADAIDQVVLADRLGIDHVWAVEHHFLEEYSHCSAPEVFLAACAARTENIRIGHGIKHTPANYNHPARVAEEIATLDLISRGRVEFGIGEGATRMELGGFGIPAKQKRAMSIEAGEQIANMMTMTPYPGYEGESFSFPCRNVVPKPSQKPHPPMWIACTNRATIELAAELGIGALAFSFVDPEEAAHWVTTYYDTIKSERCVPIGHTVNANIALVTGFSLHNDRDEAIRRGREGFEFFRYAIGAMVTEDSVPGHTSLWPQFQELRGPNATEEYVEKARAYGDAYSSAIGTPADAARHIRELEAAGVDQLIFIQQAGRNRHEDICSSLELFASEVMPEFKAKEHERLAAKEAELAPFIAAALARKTWMQPIAEDDIPVIPAAVRSAQVPDAKVEAV